MVSTHLKNIRQIGSFPQIGMKIKNIWNHHLACLLAIGTIVYESHFQQHLSICHPSTQPHLSALWNSPHITGKTSNIPEYPRDSQEWDPHSAKLPIYFPYNQAYLWEVYGNEGSIFGKKQPTPPWNPPKLPGVRLKAECARCNCLKSCHSVAVGRRSPKAAMRWEGKRCLRETVLPTRKVLIIHHTPLKINMEHNHGGLEDHFPF